MNTNDRIGHTQLRSPARVDIKESLIMLVIFSKLRRLDYCDFASEKFSLVGSGSEVNYPETVFANLELLFIIFLHIATTNSPCSMHITTFLLNNSV